MAPTRSICWKLSLRSPPAEVYRLLTTDEGRTQFWAEKAVERGGVIYFRFPNGQNEQSAITTMASPSRFEFVYFGAPTRFDIAPSGEGCVLTLTLAGAPQDDWNDVHAGWVAVLLTLKAAVDFGIDLRNHDPDRSWDARFVDQ